MNNNLSFVFKGHKEDISKGEALFNYELIKDGKTISFTEKVSFPSVSRKIPEKLLKSLLDNLMLILGISYWKLYCPQNIAIESNFLTKNQAEFWNIVYIKGLGEFFYKNKIDYRGLVQFPSGKQDSEEVISFPRKDRALLGVGGGKDSIVVAEMLKKENKEFDVHILDTQIQKDVSAVIGKKPIVFKRELDPKLFELNKEEGTYNGHIPVSVIYALLGVMACAFYDYRNFVVGNEKSANYGNVEYLGEMINHQWSKSEEFEKLFQDYVKKFITPDIIYYSPLRMMTELEVVREFVKYPQYFKVFSSCNGNFKILRSAQDDTGRWCGKCPKCFFVFTCLAAFLPKKEVLDIFGKNLFEDKDLLPLFQELLGLKNIKPFECVGTPEEMKEALILTSKKGEFNNDFLMKFFLTNEA